ncbi:hypothetical protein Poly30_12390 [Planctomycetes bacterium Poly30]|uniref:Uncharacterized protein n=1 Tax=Saltatorellus ferox TaxID=2528018 RepID=A0A518ENS0_9BACT|nr:hypothetical protein Poly30_12390 [Planctomycetes bacterium Poly30]
MNHSLIRLAALSALTCSAALAQNDDCSTAIPLTADVAVVFDTTAATAGVPFACASGGAADLWYSYTSTGTGTIVTVALCGSTYDTALEIFDGDCMAPNLLICNDDSCGLQSSADVMNAAAGITYLIRVGGFNGSTGMGTVLVTEGTVACAMPDAFEDSDDCATAFALGDGTYPGLNVEEFDNDYYEVIVANGATLDASIFFIDAMGDCDLYLWDPLVACDTNVAGPGTGTGALAVGFSASDDETVTYTNTTGADQTLVLEVDMFTVGGCNEYSLTIDGSGPGTGGIGTNYCMANPNSTGMAGSMSATGSATALDNDVTLTAAGLPMNVNGYFITSQTQAFLPNPGGSAGNVCVGGTIGRYIGAGQMQNTGASDSFSLAIDLSATPLSMGFGTVMAGETWNYQGWHRDSDAMGAATSNFTDGLSVTYQ